MSEELSDFFKLLSQEKKNQKEEIKSLVGDLNLDNVFEQFSNIKKDSKKKKIVVQEQVKKFEEWIYSPDEPEEAQSEIIEEESIGQPSPIQKSLGLLAEPIQTNNSDPLTPLNQKFATLDDLQKHYRIFLDRIQQQLSTLGGGGESNLTYMDVPVTYVTSSTYSVVPQDYYIGVNYAGAVTITLPYADREGKTFIVKDELGEASKGTNRYITVLPSGSDLIDGRDRAILAYDYGSLTFIWRGNSWRVV